MNEAAVGLILGFAILELLCLVVILVLLPEPLFVLIVLLSVLVGLVLSRRARCGPILSLSLLLLSLVLNGGGFFLIPTGDPYFTIALVALVVGLLVYGVVLGNIPKNLRRVKNQEART